MPIKDSLIAAAAVVHGLAVVTRNRADFGTHKIQYFVGSAVRSFGYCAKHGQSLRCDVNAMAPQEIRMVGG